MGIERINPVEKIWTQKNTKSKRPYREEMVPDNKRDKGKNGGRNRGKKEINDNQKVDEIDTVEIGKHDKIEEMRIEAEQLYNKMQQMYLERKKTEIQQQNSEKANDSEER